MHGLYWGFDRFARVPFNSCALFADNWWGRGLMIGLFLLTAIAVVFIVLGITKRTRLAVNSTEAMSILQKRYANGEIAKEEYERIRKDLR
jgi:uncharacterized membrane protein